MDEPLASLHLKPETLARWNLPDLAYPMPIEALASAMAADGHLPFELMLYGLQQQASQGLAPWRDLEPALARLADLVAPDDDRPVVVARGDEWWLEIGPVDLSQRIVTMQRDDCLLAAVCARPDGRLRVAAYRPLDARCASNLIAAAQVPDPVHGVCMRENNWEYLLDATGSVSHMYAAERGESHLSRWDQGMGIDWQGQLLADWHAQRTLIPRRPAAVAVELGVHYMHAP